MSDHNSTTPVMKTRRRRALACTSCRYKKLRCNRQQPCNGCVRSKDKQNVCTYATEPVAAPAASARAAPSAAQPTAASSVIPPSAVVSKEPLDAVLTSAIPSPTSHLASTREQREGQNWFSSSVGQLLVATPPSTNLSRSQSTQDVTNTGPNQDYPAKDGGISGTLDSLPAPISAMMVKTRYYSPSAWLYCALLLPHNLAWLEKINEERAESFQILQTCKLLAKHFQNLQILQWNYGEYGMLLAQKAIADVLIDNYLRTFETIHRILHIPSFMRDYELLWSENEVTPVKFIIQVQLCLALGTLVYDDDFTLRPQALHWTREAGAWLESAAKRRLMFSTIQTMCLYQLAREGLQGTYGDRIWIASGSLVRVAMSIGLHRDPTKLPLTSPAHAEMRRRLWTTVVELALSSCLDPGAAPLISLDDFDCKLPENLDDAQLILDSNDNVEPRDKDQYTDSSLQIALGRTIGTRIAIARFCTKLNPDGYDKTLRLNNDHNTACRALSESLQSLQPAPSHFQRQYCELVMSRYSFALHIQYMMICSRNPSYLLSRKVCVETALNLARSSLPLASGHDQVLATMQAMTMNQSPQGSEFVRLCICGSGPYRSALFQALMVIASELITMIEERKGSLHWPTGLLGGDMRAHELLSLLRVGAEWTRLRMRVGQEINKDHLFVTLAISNIEALMKEEAVMEAMDVSGKIACLEVELILKELLSAYSDEQIPEVRFSSEEDDLLGFDEMWLIQNGDFDTNLVDL